MRVERSPAIAERSGRDALQAVAYTVDVDLVAGVEEGQDDFSPYPSPLQVREGVIPYPSATKSSGLIGILKSGRPMASMMALAMAEAAALLGPSPMGVRPSSGVGSRIIASNSGMSFSVGSL